MKILFEKIPDYKTSSQMEVKYNKGSIFSVIDLLFPKESLLEVELEKELIACNEWNLRQKNEPAETRAPAYEDMYQYDCSTCGYSHHHSPPEVTMLWLCLYYLIFIPNFSLPSLNNTLLLFLRLFSS